MKDHEVREFVDRLTQTALKHAGCDSLRAAISREVKETLVNDSIRNSNKSVRGALKDQSKDWDALYGIKQ